MADQLECTTADAGFSTTAADLPYHLPLDLTVEDADTIAELCQHPEGDERERFALSALRIGVLALRQARGEVDGEQIRRQTDRMLLALEAQLAEHAGVVHNRLAGSLKDYFDPESGRFQERVNRLIRKDGELEDLLRRQIGTENSELSRTLAVHFGNESPLLKLLTPDESRGLLKALRDTFDEQLRFQRERILGEFSLDNKDGALSRLIAELSTRHDALTENLHGKIGEVVKEFSLDEENSALSRLVRNVEGAQRTITSEFSLDNESSALSRLKGLLEATQHAIDGNLTLDSDDSALSRLRKEVLEILAAHSKTNQSFQEEVKLALSKMVVQRQEAARSTTHGLVFEDVVCEFVSREALKLGDVATRTGETTGLIKNRKVGDCVIELGPDSAAPGARIVVEAKEKDQYPIAQARQEIDEARKNRDAQIGLFVYSASLAPDEMAAAPLLRYGADVFVAWNPEEPATDLFLKTALTLTRALCVRMARQHDAQAADFRAIDEAICEIEKRTEGLNEIETSAKTIQSGSEKILKRVDLCRKALVQQVEVLREKMDELKQLTGGVSLSES
ncbi:MAG TPA: hypothetical protein VKU82_10915 [Planctomycetaceae bacterium]|nr:hypothetical protein [Planctomycetaceae bacterium]